MDKVSLLPSVLSRIVSSKDLNVDVQTHTVAQTVTLFGNRVTADVIS